MGRAAWWGPLEEELIRKTKIQRQTRAQLLKNPSFVVRNEKIAPAGLSPPAAEAPDQEQRAMDNSALLCSTMKGRERWPLSLRDRKEAQAITHEILEALAAQFTKLQII